MGLEQASVREIVEKAVMHRWGVPEFQRGFVWTPQKVRDLIDSLWRGYPVGSFLIWRAADEVEPRTVEDAQAPEAWVVDGQQRTTAFCILTGRKPFWWSEDWNDVLKRHDVRFNILAEDEPYFSLRTAAMRGDAGRRWVSVRDVLNADDEKLSALIQTLLTDLHLPSSKFGMLWTRLDAVRRAGNVPIPILSVSLEIEDVTEIFTRLNSAGTKVTEADIALALAASNNPGWARKEFLPFLTELEEAGFEIDPNVVFRSVVAIGLNRAHLREVPHTYWTSDGLAKAWNRTQTAWRRTIQYVEQHGVLSADILPTKNALIPAVIVADRFPGTLRSPALFAWFLHATRSGRYSGSALTALESDAKAIDAAASGEEALAALTSNLSLWVPLTLEDFLQDYRDRFLRLLLYLVMYGRKARDWMTGERLGFQGTELLESFSPQWHHIFPRAYLRKEKVNEDQWDVFANIAVMAPTTNIRFGAKNPMAYLENYNIGPDLLAEQLVPHDDGLLTVERYDDFIRTRAKFLADAANEYMANLGKIPSAQPSAAPTAPGLEMVEQRAVLPKAQAEERELATREGQHFEFWQQLLVKAKAKTSLHERISPGTENWIAASAGVRGLSFNYVVLSDRARVELYIDRGRGAREENKAIFDKIAARRQEVEERFGGPLRWERLDAKRACRIRSRHIDGGLRQPDLWAATQDTLIDMMVRLREALGDSIASLRT